MELANGQRFTLEQAELYKAKVPDLVADLRENVCAYGGWIEEKVFFSLQS